MHLYFFFSSRRRHTRWPRDWSSDVCSSDLPQFEGQTKTKLGNTIARTFMVKVMTDQLQAWFESHPTEARAIVMKGQAAAMAREAARKARDATRRKSPLEAGGMPGQLRDCSSRNPAERGRASGRD